MIRALLIWNALLTVGMVYLWIRVGILIRIGSRVDAIERGYNKIVKMVKTGIEELARQVLDAVGKVIT